MDVVESFLKSFRGVYGIQIFITAFIVVFIKVGLKYSTKMNVFMVSESGKVDPSLKKAAHFDCLRIGMDLALLGIVCFISILRVALSMDGKIDNSRMAVLGTMEPVVLLVQLGLLVFATLFTGIYNSPEASYGKGITIPGTLGVISIILSVYVFFFISQGL